MVGRGHFLMVVLGWGHSQQELTMVSRDTPGVCGGSRASPLAFILKEPGSHQRLLST